MVAIAGDTTVALAAQPGTRGEPIQHLQSGEREVRIVGERAPGLGAREAARHSRALALVAGTVLTLAPSDEQQLCTLLHGKRYGVLGRHSRFSIRAPARDMLERPANESVPEGAGE